MLLSESYNITCVVISEKEMASCGIIEFSEFANRLFSESTNEAMSGLTSLVYNWDTQLL